ncbi:DUF930 domain-containing protein [Pseudorhodoplanes sinuspersici]|uniref:Uncharacterized protein n=1 Tax=Pseudorhodoplanes sinuspersici TaxID=1235591 RepID=A0A1W6ZUP6_9HYPH|nr:DUF930 domain-containing protein [Pseudorhodoplanes sinuspersici]ARQ01159.1 hypothetical protein CAK95_20195 [Pseudorhodoplanes sinuspersici]RKE72812.1 uncharacterized protein DUF930 [Pseudorhodoplanes sinuspersici]
MKQIVLTACAMLLFAAPSHAGNTRFDRSLAHLDPTTRLEQVCAVETMARVNKDANPYRPDRAVIYALSKPKLRGDTVTGDGGAFRSKGKWYQYSFTCKATPDRMKVSTFTYKVGKPIPEEKWETYGLYR